ncbi:hypothetical protein K501DRAFT_331491 [Backusella circina FSU 941]|nr:hypothetical protein K501DRAFT_331491 [Backusella circina FSU 941]
MLRLLACVSVFALFVQAIPNGIQMEAVPGYKRASLLELNGGAADIIQVAPLSRELQQRYQIEHTEEVADIEPEEPITAGKSINVLKMNRPKQSVNPNKIHLVVGMDGKGEIRMMQIPKYSRGDTLE